MENPCKHFGEYKGQRGIYPVLLDKELPALYVPQQVYSTKVGKRLDVYGSHQLVDRFIERIKEWVSLGSPKLTDYHIELMDPAESDDTVPYSYIDQRPNATLRFSLDDVPISRDYSEL